MVSRNFIIGVAVLVIVILGFMFVSNITGNVIGDFVADEEMNIKNEYFRIDDFGAEVNGTEEINDTQNNSG